MKKTHFVEIFDSNKIWAIGSIHSRLQSFNNLKNFLLKNFKENDYLIFLGNSIGVGNQSKETLTSIIELRNQLMGKFLINPERIIFLRGAQEEMFLKLLQLHTAPNPSDIIHWMFDHGVDKTIRSYGFDLDEILEISTQGTISISKWTSKLNQVILEKSGHKEYFTHLKHAAFSKTKEILFLNRGVDISRPLSAQSDCFWWGYQNFSKINKPYGTFKRIIRGYQSSEKNVLEDSKNKIVCSLYEQPISNSDIIAGIFRENGDIIDLFKSN